MKGNKMPMTDICWLKKTVTGKIENVELCPVNKVLPEPEIF